MGKATGLLAEISGRVGALMFSKKKSGKTSVYLAPEKKDTPTRTRLQMLIRLVWANLGALYTMFHKTLKQGHENLKDGMSDYNAFIQDNTKLCRVYISKSEHLSGGCVLAPVQITRGSMPSIAHEVNGAGVLVTDIDLGTLTIDDETTVSEFSIAVESNNDDFEEGDQITFFYGQQTIDSVTEVPRAKIKGFKVKLDVEDETGLWNVVSALGFSTVGGKLGMNQTIVDGAAAWIHSREDDQGNLKVSTQRLYVDSSVLSSYMGDEAFESSVESYGGLNGSRKVFLRPDNETNWVISGPLPIDGGDAGGSGGSQNGNGGNSGGNGGGNSQGGSETTTVAAPTFSGETQFTESTEVTMSGPAGASIYYTMDGSTPTSESTLYSAPVTLTDTTTIKAVAIKDGVSSSVTERTYTKGSGDNGGDMGNVN